MEPGFRDVRVITFKRAHDNYRRHYYTIEQ